MRKLFGKKDGEQIRMWPYMWESFGWLKRRWNTIRVLENKLSQKYYKFNTACKLTCHKS